MEDMNKLVNEIVEDRFHFIQEHYESNDLKNTIQDQLKADKIFKKIEQLSPEGKKLINDYDELITDFWVRVAEYYFKKGVKTGILDLSYIKNYAEVL